MPTAPVAAVAAAVLSQVGGAAAFLAAVLSQVGGAAAFLAAFALFAFLPLAALAAAAAAAADPTDQRLSRMLERALAVDQAVAWALLEPQLLLQVLWN